MDTFNFCPNSLVPETLVRDAPGVISLNSWAFSAKPSVPFQRKFKVTLNGLRWFTDHTTGAYDSTTQATINARALELFYQANETWNPFNWTHPHLGSLVVRFASPVNLPAGLPNSGGTMASYDITLIEHNPGY